MQGAHDADVTGESRARLARAEGATERDAVGAHAAAPSCLGHRGQQLHLPLRLLRCHELAAHLL